MKKVEKEEQIIKKREKKVYDLPGQKRDPPEEVCFLNKFSNAYILQQVVKQFE